MLSLCRVPRKTALNKTTAREEEKQEERKDDKIEAVQRAKSMITLIKNRINPILNQYDYPASQL